MWALCSRRSLPMFRFFNCRPARQTGERFEMGPGTWGRWFFRLLSQVFFSACRSQMGLARRMRGAWALHARSRWGAPKGSLCRFSSSSFSAAHTVRRPELLFQLSLFFRPGNGFSSCRRMERAQAELFWRGFVRSAQRRGFIDRCLRTIAFYGNDLSETARPLIPVLLYSVIGFGWLSRSLPAPADSSLRWRLLASPWNSLWSLIGLHSFFILFRCRVFGGAVDFSGAHEVGLGVVGCVSHLPDV